MRLIKHWGTKPVTLFFRVNQKNEFSQNEQERLGKCLSKSKHKYSLGPLKHFRLGRRL